MTWIPTNSDGLSKLAVNLAQVVWYAILGFNVPLDTVQVISETELGLEPTYLEVVGDLPESSHIVLKYVSKIQNYSNRMTNCVDI